MKKIVLSLALIGGLVFTSCKKDAAQENLDNTLDSIVDAVEEQVENTVEALEAKIAEAQAELDQAVTVDAKQAATKKLNEAKAALATLKGEALSTAEEVKQEATAAANKAGAAAKNTVKNTEKKVEKAKEKIKKEVITVKDGAIKDVESLNTLQKEGIRSAR